MPALLEFSTCLLLSASIAGQAPPAPAATAVQPAAIGRDGRRTISRLPANLLRGTVGVFSHDGFRPLLIGASATGLASLLDDEVRDRLADPSHGFGTSLETTGDPLYSGVAVAGLFVASRFTGNPRFRAVSYDLLDAFIVNWGYTTALKHAIHRERPDGSDNVSFPSGHSSNAFTLATVVERHFGWRAGIPAYTFASAMAVSRLQRNKHWLSDVVGGAALGYVVGRSVVRVNGLPLDSKPSPQVSVVPLVGRRTRALSFSLAF